MISQKLRLAHMIRLASASETRAKMLKNAKIDFIQSPSFFDEDTIDSTCPKNFVYLATLGKYKEAFNKFGCEVPLLCADTVVTANDKILRKAKNEDEARTLLDTQSGNIVSIITCMIYKSQRVELIDISSTDYEFEKFESSEIDSFIKSGEWQGKAGACMVEGFCKKYIKSVKGYESCAMGLTLEILKPFLEGNA